jgi:hypothetical protein
MTPIDAVPAGYSVADYQALMALDGEQTCSCCGIRVMPEGADVFDREVFCMDCLSAYHPNVYRARCGYDGDDDE